MYLNGADHDKLNPTLDNLNLKKQATFVKGWGGVKQGKRGVKFYPWGN